VATYHNKNETLLNQPSFKTCGTTLATTKMSRIEELMMLGVRRSNRRSLQRPRYIIFALITVAAMLVMRSEKHIQPQVGRYRTGGLSSILGPPPPPPPHLRNVNRIRYHHHHHHHYRHLPSRRQRPVLFTPPLWRSSSSKKYDEISSRFSPSMISTAASWSSSSSLTPPDLLDAGVLKANRLASEQNVTTFLRIHLGIRSNGSPPSLQRLLANLSPAAKNSSSKSYHCSLGDPSEHLFVWSAPGREEEEENVFVGVGSVASCNFTGIRRFDLVKDFISKSLQNGRVVDVYLDDNNVDIGEEDSSEEKANREQIISPAADLMINSNCCGSSGENQFLPPLFVGGFSFSPDRRRGGGKESSSSSLSYRDEGPWCGYPDAHFWLPRIIVQLPAAGGGGKRYTTYATATVAIDPNDNRDRDPALLRSKVEELIGECFDSMANISSISSSASSSSRGPSRQKDEFKKGEEEEENEINEKQRRQDLDTASFLHSQLSFMENNNNSESIDHAKWLHLVNRAVDTMQRQGSTMNKVVLARRKMVKVPPEGPLDVGSTILNLCDRFPDCHTFLLRLPGMANFFGSTPERLVRMRGETLETTALAGTRPRGHSTKTDMLLAEELLSSPKDLEEHRLVVSEIMRTLGPLSSSLSVPQSPKIRALRNVLHLETPISIRLLENSTIGLLDAVHLLHPTPALGGSPRKEALQWMQANEEWERGWYAAPIGWIDSNGDGEFVVAIRSAVSGNNHDTKDEITLFAGCGIVSASDAESEWKETNMKLDAILKAIVTLDNGRKLVTLSGAS